MLLLGIGKVAFLDPLASDFALIAAPQTIGFALLAIVLLVASVGVKRDQLEPFAAQVPAARVVALDT